MIENPRARKTILLVAGWAGLSCGMALICHGLYRMESGASEETRQRMAKQNQQAIAASVQQQDNGLYEAITGIAIATAGTFPLGFRDELSRLFTRRIPDFSPE